MYDTYNSKYIPCKVEEILAVEWNRPQIPSLAMFTWDSVHGVPSRSWLSTKKFGT